MTIKVKGVERNWRLRKYTLRVPRKQKSRKRCLKHMREVLQTSGHWPKLTRQGRNRLALLSCPEPLDGQSRGLWRELPRAYRNRLVSADYISTDHIYDGIDISIKYILGIRIPTYQMTFSGAIMREFLWGI